MIENFNGVSNFSIVYKTPFNYLASLSGKEFINDIIEKKLYPQKRLIVNYNKLINDNLLTILSLFLNTTGFDVNEKNNDFF